MKFIFETLSAGVKQLKNAKRLFKVVYVGLYRFLSVTASILMPLLLTMPRKTMHQEQGEGAVVSL